MGCFEGKTMLLVIKFLLVPGSPKLVESDLRPRLVWMERAIKMQSLCFFAFVPAFGR